MGVFEDMLSAVQTQPMLASAGQSPPRRGGKVRPKKPPLKRAMGGQGDVPDPMGWMPQPPLPDVPDPMGWMPQPPLPPGAAEKTPDYGELSRRTRGLTRSITEMARNAKRPSNLWSDFQKADIIPWKLLGFGEDSQAAPATPLPPGAAEKAPDYGELFRSTRGLTRSIAEMARNAKSDFQKADIIPWKLLGFGGDSQAPPQQNARRRPRSISNAARGSQLGSMERMPTGWTFDSVIDDLRNYATKMPLLGSGARDAAAIRQAMAKGMPQPGSQTVAPPTPEQFTQATRQSQQAMPQPESQADPLQQFIEAWRTAPMTGEPSRLSPSTVGTERLADAMSQRLRDAQAYRQRLESGGPVEVGDPNFNPYQGGAMGRRVARLGPGKFRAHPMQPATVGMGAPAPEPEPPQEVDMGRLAEARARNLYNPYGGLDERDSELKDMIARAQDRGVDFLGQSKEEARMSADADRARFAAMREARQQAMAERAAPLRAQMGDAAQGFTDEDLLGMQRGVLPRSERARRVQQNAAQRAEQRQARMAGPSPEEQMMRGLMARSPGAYANLLASRGQDATRRYVADREFDAAMQGDRPLTMQDAALAAIASGNPQALGMLPSIERYFGGGGGSPAAGSIEVGTMDWTDPQETIDSMIESGASEQEIESAVRQAVRIGLVSPDTLRTAARGNPINPAGDDEVSGLVETPFGQLMAGTSPIPWLISLLAPEESAEDAAMRRRRQSIARRVAGVPSQRVEPPFGQPMAEMQRRRQSIARRVAGVPKQ